jgi:hypothetical protein
MRAEVELTIASKTKSVVLACMGVCTAFLAGVLGERLHRFCFLCSILADRLSCAALVIIKRRHKVLIAASNQFCVGIVAFA